MGADTKGGSCITNAPLFSNPLQTPSPPADFANHQGMTPGDTTANTTLGTNGRKEYISYILAVLLQAMAIAAAALDHRSALCPGSYGLS